MTLDTPEQVKELAATATYGRVVAENVTFDDYLELYAANFSEFVDGKVVALSPVHLSHDKITAYVRMMLDTYFALRPIGQVAGEPFVMKLLGFRFGREPDLQVILNESLDRLHETYMDGPADIVIEVVSPESVVRDHGEKFDEYEKGGVPEYWILDPIHNDTRFYRRVDDKFSPVKPDTDEIYATPRLPGFKFHVPVLWQRRLPNAIEIVDAVKAMLNRENP